MASVALRLAGPPRVNDSLQTACRLARHCCSHCVQQWNARHGRGDSTSVQVLLPPNSRSSGRLPTHLESWLVVRTRYNPVCTTLYSGIVLYRLVLLSLSMYFLSQVRTQYVLFTPSTYRVCTSQISMYSVRTKYRKQDKSTYFRLKVRTFVSHTSTYRYVLSTYFFAYSCTNFSSFRKGTYLVHADSGGVCTFGS
jgi:hypothetical protein